NCLCRSPRVAAARNLPFRSRCHTDRVVACRYCGLQGGEKRFLPREKYLSKRELVLQDHSGSKCGKGEGLGSVAVVVVVVVDAVALPQAESKAELVVAVDTAGAADWNLSN